MSIQSTRLIDPKEAALQKKCFLDGENWTLSPQSEFYHQIQGNMAITNTNWCDLIIYTKKGIHVTRVKFNEQFWINLEDNLVQFYLEHVIPYILRNKDKYVSGLD